MVVVLGNYIKIIFLTKMLFTKVKNKHLTDLSYPMLTLIPKMLIEFAEVQINPTKSFFNNITKYIVL